MPKTQRKSNKSPFVNCLPTTHLGTQPKTNIGTDREPSICNFCFKVSSFWRLFSKPDILSHSVFTKQKNELKLTTLLYNELIFNIKTSKIGSIGSTTSCCIDVYVRFLKAFQVPPFWVYPFFLILPFLAFLRSSYMTSYSYLSNT